LYGHVFEGIFQSADEINTVPPDDPLFDPNKHAYQHPQTKPGDVKFKDINGRDEDGNLTGQPDGQIDVDDQTYLGSPFPKFTYGFNASADYKGFDISIFIQGVYGNKVYNGLYQVMNSLVEGNYSVESYENYWREDRPSDTWPRPTRNDHNGNNRASDRWIQDGSYLKIQNVQLGYTIPVNILNRIQGIGIENFRIYLQAQNLFSFTKLVCYDPDFINDRDQDNPVSDLFTKGVLGGSFPSPRTLMVGVSLSL